MNFYAPEWLWALLALPLFIYLFLWNEHKRAELLRQLVAARLQERLAGTVSAWRRRLRFLLLLLGWTCVVLSLARPQFGYTWEQTKRKGRDLIIAIDTSRSMLAGDLPPNRLTRARLAAHDLLALLTSDRVGVIAFAGRAFLQAPLTIDYGAVLETINELDTDIIPRGGTNIAEAIRVAVNAFGKGESENRALIIFTDGEELDDDAVQTARRHAEELRIFTIGVGTESGSVIPMPDERGGTSFVKDPKGEIVKTRLDEEKLRKISEITGGFYIRLENGPQDMQRVVSDGLGAIAERELDARMSRRPIERYQWPLALALLLLGSSLFVSERKRAKAAAPFALPRAAAAASAMLLALPVTARGASGVDLYKQQQYEQAYGLFQKQLERLPQSEALEFNLGTAAYKLGNYDKALEAFGKAITTDDSELRGKSQYNLGNTLFQRGLQREDKKAKLDEWRSALKHYDEALALAPDFSDAKHNRDVVRQLIEELEQEEPPPPPPQEQEEQEQEQQQQNDQSDDQKDQQKQQDQQNKQDQKDQQDQQQSNQQDQQSDQQQQDQEQAKQQSSQDPQEEQQQKDSAQQQQEKNNQEQTDQQQQTREQDQQQSDQQQSQQQDQQQDAQQPQDQQQQTADTQQPSQQQPTPGPAPQQPERKLEGELRAEGAPQPAPEEQPVEEMEQPGQMNQRQAAALLESLKDEDAKVSLDEHRSSESVIRDW